MGEALTSEKPKKEDQKSVLEREVSLGKALTSEQSLRSTAGSGDSCSEITPPSVRNLDDDWYSFRDFLNQRMRPLTLSGCTAKDAIDFLCMRQTSGNAEALVGRLSAACEAYGITPKENHFRSLAVISYLKGARGITREEDCVVVFSCNDNLDEDETHLTEAIMNELHEQGVTPLTYNLSQREKLDGEKLYSSSVGIMVVSNSSAYSSQPLDHLVAIMEHWKAKHIVIIPVYLKITPSDICRLEGRFDQVLPSYSDSVQVEKIQKWKAALTELASIDGHQWSKGSQFMLTKKVVRNTCLRLDLKNSKNLVRILALLSHPQPLHAEIEGIWGMAGIGKTSIAREIFEILAPQYDLCYFLKDFHRTCKSKGLRQIRDDFLSKVFREEKPCIGACDTKPSFMRDWFQNRAILVVLDDVSNARDAEYVVGGFSWFSRGHRIILTSRSKQVLVQCKVKEPYEMQQLCEFESFRLCKLYLKEESAIMSELISCSSGIPLALKVLVSSVSKQHMNSTRSLRVNPPTKIQEAFRRSFDGLDENGKNIFLDLACFFRGENKDHVVQLLDACGFFTYLGICDLIDESLISLLNNRIEIPIPFQDIGRFIVHEEDMDPCERSRLWDSNDIIDVLTNNSGTEAIEGIFLDASDLTCELSPTVFSKMYRLRLLKFYCSNTSGNQCKLSLPQGLDTLPDELRLLHWEHFPLGYLPQKFIPENLVEINMCETLLLHPENFWLRWLQTALEACVFHHGSGMFGDLDVLVVDMPPGTGDAQITISQNLKLSGAVVVSTPQDIALADAKRGISMFDKVRVPILGLVENMSCFICRHCNEASFIFGKEGARRMAAKKGLKLIGEIPLEMKIREASDEGVPVVVSSPGSVVSKAYEDLAQNVVNGLKELRDNPENEIQMKLNVPHSSRSS
ncbi:hypothetical protein Bca52824_091521 [Brassica carinata]|uniref:Uncharacterized protein n=1 Tax=Brassica carinata TaxID=52824 RepID=A0A8X7NW39_BRACI|nr:hypothetical protein Bca52824_091521 [Brassica carinata]